MKSEPMVDVNAPNATSAEAKVDPDSSPASTAEEQQQQLANARKRERNECRRCETWRDELTRESKLSLSERFSRSEARAHTHTRVTLNL